MRFHEKNYFNKLKTPKLISLAFPANKIYKKAYYAKKDESRIADGEKRSYETTQCRRLCKYRNQ